MNITVFCGASLGTNSIYREKAIELGKWIASNNHRLIYGGGKIGLMGLLADTVLENGGKVTGIIPTFLVEREISHPDITELITVDNMSDRKNYMVEMGDAFLALPGGPGTLEEITQVISWARVGENDCPCIMMNVNGYYNYIEDFFNKMVNEGFLSPEDNKNTLFSENINEIEEFIINYRKPKIRTYN